MFDADKEFIHSFFWRQNSNAMTMIWYEYDIIFSCEMKIYNQGYPEKVFSNVGLPKNNLKLTDIPLDNW